MRILFDVSLSLFVGIRFFGLQSSRHPNMITSIIKLRCGSWQVDCPSRLSRPGGASIWDKVDFFALNMTQEANQTALVFR